MSAWGSDPAMAGWRRALEEWGKELEWKSGPTDAWLECANDTWVRWSHVKAIEVRPALKGDEYDVVFVLEMNERFIAYRHENKAAARQAVIDIIRKISNDWRQSA